MQRLEIENVDIMKVAIQQEIARSEDSRYDHRLHGVFLLCQGFSCPEVSKILGDSPRIIEYWVKEFNENGFEGLREEKRSGRPSVIDRTIINNIESDLRHNPGSFGYTQNLWDGKMLSHHLKEKYDIKLGVRQCQRLFNKLDFRLRKTHTVIAKSDDEAKAELKFNK
ncbi:MAG: helix-turn-helix domain-containing protein [bacterium]|nr:helix-turn-helix domain-containing protein [bacterium]